MLSPQPRQNLCPRDPRMSVRWVMSLLGWSKLKGWSAMEEKRGQFGGIILLFPFSSSSINFFWTFCCRHLLSCTSHSLHLLLSNLLFWTLILFLRHVNLLSIPILISFTIVTVSRDELKGDLRKESVLWALKLRLKNANWKSFYPFIPPWFQSFKAKYKLLS